MTVSYLLADVIWNGGIMKISRLFQIIYILLERGTTTAPELASRFEVSVRTIYRDIETLSQSGIPIYSIQGKGGGISITEKFVLNKSLISEKEQDEILFALQSLSAAQYPDTDTVLSKLSSLFKKSDVSWIEVDFSSWGSDDKLTEIFILLKNAILEQRVITFSYFNIAGEKSHRRVEPVKLIFKDKAWYLKGYCLERIALRIFKISRMSNFNITDEYCFNQNLQELLPNAIGDFSSEQVPLKLKISSEGAYRVYDDFAEKTITKNEDGYYIVNVSAPGGEWLYPYLLSFGTLLEVLEPPSVRKEIAKPLGIMSKMYAFY